MTSRSIQDSTSSNHSDLTTSGVIVQSTVYIDCPLFAKECTADEVNTDSGSNFSDKPNVDQIMAQVAPELRNCHLDFQPFTEIIL